MWPNHIIDRLIWKVEINVVNSCKCVLWKNKIILLLLMDVDEKWTTLIWVTYVFIPFIAH